MPQSFPGFNPPAAGFDAPIDMLSSCHDKLVQRCQTLSRLPDHVGLNGADEQARSAAQSLLKYFDGPARFHHADEEQDLFPALLETMAGSDAVCLRQLFDRLSTEHRSLEAQWQKLRPFIVDVSEGRPASLPRSDVQTFIDEYACHLQCEEQELLPLARRLLDATALEQMGLAMHARRNPS